MLSDIWTDQFFFFMSARKFYVFFLLVRNLLIFSRLDFFTAFLIDIRILRFWISLWIIEWNSRGSLYFLRNLGMMWSCLAVRASKDFWLWHWSAGTWQSRWGPHILFLLLLLIKWNNKLTNLKRIKINLSL